MGRETPAGGGGHEFSAFAAMPSAWVATITLALSAAFLATGAGTTSPIGDVLGASRAFARAT